MNICHNRHITGTKLCPMCPTPLVGYRNADVANNEGVDPLHAIFRKALEHQPQPRPANAPRRRVHKPVGRPFRYRRAK